MALFTERRFAVNGYHLAAKQWGDPQGLPVIALHGWLDNAASFDVLAPLLPNCCVVALELAGHGHSDHRRAPATYHLWDELPDILAAADQLGWQQFVLLAHSRGAAVATLLASAMPERVQALVLLDGIWPPPVEPEDAPWQMRQFLQDARRERESLRGYTQLDDAVAVRCRASELSEQAARLLVERGVEWRDGKYFWRSSSRLFNASALKMSSAHCEAFARAIACPCWVLVAERGFGRDQNNVAMLQRVAESAQSPFHYALWPAAHHCHMEAEAPTIAASIVEFLRGLN